MNSLEIREFKNTIINYINNQNFPAEVKSLVLADISNQILNESNNEIRQEIAERDKKERKEEKNAESV